MYIYIHIYTKIVLYMYLLLGKDAESVFVYAAVCVYTTSDTRRKAWSEEPSYTFPQTMPESKIPSALHRGLHHLRQWELSGLSPSLRPSMMYSITRNLRQKPVHSLVN